jgi:hypothetical protein
VTHAPPRLKNSAATSPWTAIAFAAFGFDLRYDFFCAFLARRVGDDDRGALGRQTFSDPRADPF